jgi:general secretion pathway protein I
MSVDDRGQSGFTLIEMLVALAVFSLAALALLRLQGVTLSTTADLDQKLVGQIVARNLAVELLSNPAPPSLGEQGGMVENGGRQWRWTRDAEITDDPRIMKIDIRVSGVQGGSPNMLTIVRPVK